MRRHALMNLGRVLVGAAVLSCVGTDRVTAPGESTGLSLPAEGPQAVTLAALAAGRLLWQRESTEEHSIWELNPTAWGSFPTFISIPQYVPTGWKIVTTGDFNADGNTDIVWENPAATPKNTVWWMNGNVYSNLWAPVKDVSNNDPPKVWSITAAGDFDKDGKPDLVWVNTETGDRSIWYMNGTRAARYGDFGLMSRVPLVWRIVGTGDFDGDGQLDLVWENLTELNHNLRRSIWYLNPGSTYTGRNKMLNELDVPDGWSIAAVADVDRDGMPDLVWQNSSTGEHSIWFMNRSTIGHTVVLQPTLGLADRAWSIAGVLSSGPTQPPSAPTNLTATIGTGILWDQIQLRWVDASNNESGFRIEGCAVAVPVPAGGCQTFTEIATVGPNVTSFLNTGLSSGTSYTYRIRAYNDGGTSTYSNTATQITVFIISLPGPSNLVATPVSTSQINLTWTDRSTSESGFKIERMIIPEVGALVWTEIAQVGANSTSYMNTGLKEGTTYYYRVRAYNASGNSPYSNEAHATTLTETFYASFDNLVVFNSRDPSNQRTVWSNSQLAVGSSFVYDPDGGLFGFIRTASLMKFDVQSAIAGKTIIEAKLRLYELALPTLWDGSFRLAAVATNWNPSTITWDTWYTQNWQIYVDGQQSFSAIASSTVPLEFDVTTIVQNWANQTMVNNGFQIWEPNFADPGYTAGTQTDIQSRELYNAPTMRPQLFIRYR